MRDKLLIKNVSVFLPRENKYDVRDILVEQTDGINTVKAVDVNIEAEDASAFNAYGCTAMPSFVDLWSRMGEPDGDKRESFSTGTNAALNGGFGTVLAAPYGKPATDDPSVLLKRKEKAKSDARCEVKFCGALTFGMLGKKLCDHAAMMDAGAVAFSDGMNERLPDDLLREAMLGIAKLRSLLIVTPRISPFYSDCCVNLGKVSGFLGLKGVPKSAEAIDLSRYLILAAETGCRLHVAGVSTEQGVEAVYQAKRRGADVTASAFPANYSFSQDDLFFYGSMAKVWPPLRETGDLKAVRDALLDGTLDCVSSCHTPLTDAQKGSDIAASEFGVTGLQTAFSSAASYLFPGDTVDKTRLCQLFSEAPSEILGIKKTRIEPGNEADFSIVSFDRDFIVSENFLKSRSGNSIFKGLTLRGSVERTVLPYSRL